MTYDNLPPARPGVRSMHFRVHFFELLSAAKVSQRTGKIKQSGRYYIHYQYYFLKSKNIQVDQGSYSRHL